MRHKPNGSIEIRPYRDTDLDRVRWLFARTPPWGRTYPAPQPLPEELEDVSRNFALAWVALEQDMAGEAVVGFAAVSAFDASEPDETPDFVDLSRRMSRIRWLSVAPERWRVGIGRLLVQETIDWARAEGYEAALVETTVQQQAAIALYEAMGFVQAGEYLLHGRWQQTWMELALPRA